MPGAKSAVEDRLVEPRAYQSYPSLNLLSQTPGSVCYTLPMGRCIFFCCCFLLLHPLQNSHAEVPSKFSGRAISLDIHDADIHSVLRMFADLNHTNIVAHPDVNGKVKRLRLLDVPSDQAFDLILRTYGLFAVREGNVTIIYPLNTYLHDASQR